MCRVEPEARQLSRSFTSVGCETRRARAGPSRDPRAQDVFLLTLLSEPLREELRNETLSCHMKVRGRRGVGAGWSRGSAKPPPLSEQRWRGARAVPERRVGEELAFTFSGGGETRKIVVLDTLQVWARFGRSWSGVDHCLGEALRMWSGIR